MTRFERHGTCRSCGNCCHLSMSNPTLWSQLRRSALGDDMRELDQPDSTVVFSDRCYMLGEDNRCEDYDHRPTVCRQHPKGPGDLIAGCGYYFLEFSGENDDELVAIHRPGQMRKIV